jgi:hypothetical protein
MQAEEEAGDDATRRCGGYSATIAEEETEAAATRRCGRHSAAAEASNGRRMMARGGREEEQRPVERIRGNSVIFSGYIKK